MNHRARHNRQPGHRAKETHRLPMRLLLLEDDAILGAGLRDIVDPQRRT